MFSLSDLPWLVLIVGGALYLWHSDQFKTRARELAIDHCRRLDLQLLDHSMVICGLWPVRSETGKWLMRRRYRFEFASTGDRRYRGELVLIGLWLHSIDLEAYRIPPED